MGTCLQLSAGSDEGELGGVEEGTLKESEREAGSKKDRKQTVK